MAVPSFFMNFFGSNAKQNYLRRSRLQMSGLSPGKQDLEINTCGQRGPEQLSGGPPLALANRDPPQTTSLPDQLRLLLVDAEVREETFHWTGEDEDPNEAYVNIKPGDLHDSYPLMDTVVSESKVPYKVVHIEGPPKLRTSLEHLCRDFADIFAEAVKPEPARLSPMELNVRDAEWKVPKNCTGPRPQGTLKRDELQKQVAKLMKLNVLEKSTATAYSQVHLVKKPDGSFRFCIDYVKLNAVTDDMERWPIPNIKQMLQRIGERKARFFAIMDLTSGYHQAPLSERAKVYSAFTTFAGVYQWKRVPMGLKGAPAYFQRMMSTEVLGNLMYTTCEVYLDDILVMGRDEEELVENLREVFTRFRKVGLTCNPKKCRFGLTEVEYVGHLLGHKEVGFAPAKLSKVLNFVEPTKMRDMKGFLGLCNYFRDHVRDYAQKVKPLHDMVVDYKKGKPLQWTQELKQRYEQVKEEVANCPTLFFLDPEAPVFVQTDASDYGMGAYIFQIIAGKECPTLFVSKSFSKQQQKWSTPEKEAFAIYYTLRSNAHLLRDIPFTLQTDHKNLTYIDMKGSPKVQRWKWELQEFNFKLQHIPGEKNLVADQMSRLVSEEEEEDGQLALNLVTTE
eukprot:gene16763-11993_t